MFSECIKKINCSQCKGKHSLSLCFKLHKSENNKKINLDNSDIITAISNYGSDENRKKQVFYYRPLVLRFLIMNILIMPEFYLIVDPSEVLFL